MNVHYKIYDNNIINYCFRILLSIIKSQDYPYNVKIKIRIENIAIKLNHKYYSNFVHIYSILDHIVINNETICYVDNGNLLVNYLIFLLTKNYDDIYDIDNIKEHIRKKIENQNIIYRRMRKIIRHLLVDDLYQMIFNNLDFVDQHKFRIMNTYFQKFKIIRLLDNYITDHNSLYKFNQEILNNYLYAKSLSIRLNNKLLNIDHMTNLKCLYISHAYNDNTIEKLLIN